MENKELEEAAERYSENWEEITGLDYDVCVPYEVNKVDFINGVKSDAAKEYWYQQFQKEQDNIFSKEDVISIVEKSRKTGLDAEYLINLLLMSRI
jgi:hypothetical protein